jgi:uncharacterized protein YdeI (YjbR/CyaY-like superfamily)
MAGLIARINSAGGTGNARHVRGGRRLASIFCVEVNKDRLRFFRTPAELRRWLAKNHDRSTELWIGFYRKDSGKGGINYAQALDEALCYGWIDGIRKKLDDESFTTRFTPRKPTSIWSNVNIAHVARLTKEGRMQPPGHAAFAKRTSERSGVYSFERESAELEPQMQKEFRKHRNGWKFFESQPPYYRRVASWWVISAKRDETRSSRLQQLITRSDLQERLPQFTPAPRTKIR